MKHTITLLSTLLLGPLASLRAADLKLATVLSDHMVLQRDKPVPVWGWADAGESITVDFAGQKKSAIADAIGKWQVKLDPLTASAESRALIVQSGKPDRKLQVADEDKQWKPAQATIEGDKVIVSSTEVAKPVAVRYAWASVAVCNLFNGAGLPASPFRTDAWPVDDAAKADAGSSKISEP